MSNNKNNSNNETGFDFTEGEISEDELMVDSTDHTDYAEKEKNKRLWKIIATFTIIGLVGVGLLFGTLSFINKNHEETKEPETQQTEATAKPTNNPHDESNPIAESFPNAPEVKPSESKAKIKDTNITTTDGIKLNIKGSKLEKTQLECKVKNPTDFCLAGYAEVRDIKTHVYYLKDAAHSRLFEAAENFEKIDIEGAKTAGTMTINLKDKTPIIAVVADDSSGFFITLPDNTPETAQTIAQALKISKDQ